jgi:tetratricopeptide (TPR) repeat protein
MAKAKVKKKHTTQPKLSDKKINSSYIYGVLLILAVIFYFYTQEFSFIQDDSFITYRYVKNFTEGIGLVFNAGEKVEGYTCFSWIILLSIVKVAGFNFISASQTLGIIFSILSIYFTYKICFELLNEIKNQTVRMVISLTPSVLIISNGAFAYWAVSGMETGLFAFLVTLGIYLYLIEFKPTNKKFEYSSIVFLLASLTRPEGNLIFALTILHRLIYNYLNSKNSSSKKKLIDRRTLIWLGIYFIPALLYMAWRLWYYGSFFPNTFYAKTGSSVEYLKAGVDYVVDFSKTYGLYGILILLTLLNLREKAKFPEYFYLLIVFFIYSFYIIYIGGDVLRPNRFFVPVMPVFYILVTGGIIQLTTIIFKNSKESTITGIALVTCIIIAYVSYKIPHESIKRYSELENGLVEKMKLSGLWLKDKQHSAGKQLTVAASTIGAVSYYSETILIDMLGLTDKEIAHNPKPIAEISENASIGWKERQYNVDYVLSRKPDYIYFSTGIKPSAFAERGLFTSDEFMKYYYPYYFVIREQNFGDFIYKRKTDTEISSARQIPLNPKYKKSYVNLYNQAMNTSRDKTKLNEAITLYNKSAEEGPLNFGAPYQMIADIYLNSKNLDKAFEYYQKALERDDYLVMAHYGLYQVYSQRGDTLNANLQIEKIKKYNPELLK